MRGTVLVELRRDLGWSQERLASELGVERQAIADLEESPDITPMVQLAIASLRDALAQLIAGRPVTQPTRR